MDIQTILALCKMNRGISTTAYDTLWTLIINSALKRIQIEGVTLNASDAEDQMLVVLYACWLWDQREEPSEMPRALRYGLNNRLFSQKLGDQA